MEWNLQMNMLMIVAAGVTALVAVFFLTALFKPLAVLLKLALYAVTGVILLAISNFILGFLDMHLAVNFFTILIAGVLQVPGIIMLLIISQWFI